MLDQSVDLKPGCGPLLTPQKKMKKRKELNALIGLGDGKRRKIQKLSSAHRLLLHREEPGDSDSPSSSDPEQHTFSLTGNNTLRLGWWRCCSVCYPLCAFVVLAACLIACAGLIWMQIALKEDLDQLKEKLRTLEAGQKASSHEIPILTEELKVNQRKEEELENGERGLSRLWSNITEINKKISSLDSAVNHLKSNIKSASDLISLPTTVEELQKSVATIGSTLTSVQHDVTMLQVLIQERQSEPGVANQQEESRKLNDPAEGPNASGPPTTPSPAHPRHRRFLNQNRVQRAAPAAGPTVLFAGVQSLKDLENLLGSQLDSSSSSGLSYTQLRQILGSSTPDLSFLAPFDLDGDGMFSLSELRTAAAL